MGLIHKYPKKISWTPNEGTWRATCCAVLDFGDEVKINFTVDVPGLKTVEYRAGNKYEGTLEEGTRLYNDLNSWLKGDFSCLLDDQNDIDLRRLVGLKADVVLTHIDNGRPAPYVHIAVIRPSGALLPPVEELMLKAA